MNCENTLSNRSSALIKAGFTKYDKFKAQFVKENPACADLFDESKGKYRGKFKSQGDLYFKSALKLHKGFLRNDKVQDKQAERAEKSAAAPPAKPILEPIQIPPTEQREQQWQAIKHHLLTNFLRPDIEAGRVLLATVASHRLAAYPPSWAMAIAPPGSLKTELLEALDGLPDVHLIDEFTANTFISGKLQDDPHEERKVPASLLHRIGDTGIIIIPDLSTITEIDPKVRGKILSQLRRVYDGHLRREFGSDENMEEREWKGRITVLAGATPDVDRHQKVFAGLGDRFTRIRWPRAGGAEAALMAMEKDRQVSEILKKQLQEFLLPILSWPELKAPTFPRPLLVRLAHLSELVALARTYVPRNGHDREIDGSAEAESNTRLPQELIQIGRGWATLMNRAEVNEEDFALIRRAAWDTIPPLRRKVLEALQAKQSPYTLSLPRVMVSRALEELQIVGLVIMQTKGAFGEEQRAELSAKALELLEASGSD